MNVYYEDNIYDLTNACVLQACKEYKIALKCNDKYRINELEKFFKSEQFRLYTRYKVSGQKVIDELKRQVNEKPRMLKSRKADK